MPLLGVPPPEPEPPPGDSVPGLPPPGADPPPPGTTLLTASSEASATALVPSCTGAATSFTTSTTMPQPEVSALCTPLTICASTPPISGMPWIAVLIFGTAAAAMVAPDIDVSALGSVPSGMFCMLDTRELTWLASRPVMSTARTTLTTGASTADGLSASGVPGEPWTLVEQSPTTMGSAALAEPPVSRPVAEMPRTSAAVATTPRTRPRM